MTSEDPRQDDAPPATDRRELPEPPDISRVHDLRRRMRSDRAGRREGPPRPASRPGGDELGRRARDVGMYTVIPMMMVVGPALGYLLGLFIERRFGGAPWPTAAGALWGLGAAFRQIYLILKRKNSDDGNRHGPPPERKP